MPPTLSPLDWIAQMRTSRHPAQWTSRALATTTHQPLATAETTIAQALTRGWIVLQLHWVCPTCDTTLAITDPEVSAPGCSLCDRCGEDLTCWRPQDLPRISFYHTLPPHPKNPTK